MTVSDDDQREHGLDQRDQGLAAWRDARRLLGASGRGGWPGAQSVVEAAAAAIVWSAEPLSACHEMLTEELDLSWCIPEVQVGDLIVTVVRTEPPLVIGADRVSGVEDDTVTLDTAVRPRGPVPWDELALTAQVFDAYSGSVLSGDEAQRLLAALRTALREPSKVLVPTVPCAPGIPSPQDLAVAVSAVLAGRADGAGRCGGCQQALNPASLEVHYFVPRGETLADAMPLVERAEHVTLLCSGCHRLCHEPTLAELRQSLGARCPLCGSLRSVVLGTQDDLRQRATSEDSTAHRCCADCGALYATVVLSSDDEG